MNAKSGNRRTATALVLWVATLILTGAAFGQTAERYVTLDFNRATAHVFDAATNTEVAAIKVGNGPNSIVISPNGRLAFVSHFNSNYVSVIDLTIAAEIKRIPALVFQLGISADGATVVGTDQNDDGITVIDAGTLSVIRTISFNGRLGDDPTVDGDAFASNPVVVGNTVYLETGFDFGVIDLGTGIVTDLGSTPASNFLSPISDVSAATADGRFVMINRDGALVFINTSTNLVRSASLDFTFAFAVSASRTVSDNGVNYAYILRIVGATVHFSIVDVPFGIIGDLALPQSFPIDLFAHIVPNSDGTRVLLTTHSVKPNVYIVDTSDPFAPALVGSPISLNTNIRGVDERITLNQPPATAPVVAAVSAPLVVNSAATALQVSGSGFAPDAQVRIGHLDPHAAQFISPSLLQILVPADAPAQNASIIVTNPNLSQGAAGADQSGILRNAFVIASGPAFQPVNQVAVVNAGDATLSVLNASTTATPNPIFPAPDRIMALAITPDGKRAYVERTVAPATVDVFDFTTNSFVASIPLNASPAGQPSQTRGIVIASRFSTGKPAAYVASSVRTGPGRFSLNLYVIDADPASATFNTVVATLPTGEPQASPSSGGIAVTPDGHFAFVNGFEANGTGDLVILDLTSGVSTVIPMGTLGVSAFQPALELSPDARFLVLVANDGSAHVFDVSNPAAPILVATIQSTPPAGFGPLLLQPRIIGNTMYTFDHIQNVVAIFNFNPAANNFSQLATFAFPAAPTTFAVVHDVTPDGKLMYLPLREQDSVAVVDTAKVLAGDPSALLTEIGAGISPHLAVVRPVPPVAIATAARYTGDRSQNYHDIANLSATLVVQGTSSPISGQTITFTLGTQSCAGTTDAFGVAACGITLNQVPGSYTVKASFAGSGSQQAAADSAAFTITREETATSYTGPAVLINGANTTFSAILQEDGTAAIAGRTITITLGSGSTAQTCNGITGATGTVSCSIVVNQPSGPGTVAASFAGDAFYLPSSGSAASTVVVITATRYTGDTTRNYHDIANLSATLTVQGTSVPIPNQTITFTLGTQSCAGTTGATGVAACSIVLNQVPGFYTVNASFAGLGNQQASGDSRGFTITGEETATTYTGPTVIANGANTTFSAVLKEDGAVAIVGRTITITLGSGSTAQTCTGATDATGTVNCSILVNQPLGPGTVAANFTGDALYLPSSSGAATILFAFPAQGAFVLGDQTASGAVEFWGDNWATVNMLSGGPAPDAFKGFAANTSEPPACGSAWTTDPGNSSQPPAGTLPSYMGVVVSTRVSMSGSTFSGDVSRIIVVTPNAGYDPNPGHPGTGTVVATYCATGR
jgi:DNA-binding beta-propeller fold protein YncE